MKMNILSTLKLILADRLLLMLVGLVLLAGIGYCFYVGASLHPSDLQVAVHYSAYGETRFYREKWYYLISFIVFGVTILAVHISLIFKFYMLERRHLAIAFACLTLLLLAITTILTYDILQVAFL